MSSCDSTKYQVVFDIKPSQKALIECLLEPNYTNAKTLSTALCLTMFSSANGKCLPILVGHADSPLVTKETEHTTPNFELRGVYG